MDDVLVTERLHYLGQLFSRMNEMRNKPRETGNHLQLASLESLILQNLKNGDALQMRNVRAESACHLLDSNSFAGFSNCC